MKHIIAMALMIFAISPVASAESMPGAPPAMKKPPPVGEVPKINPFIADCMEKELPNAKGFTKAKREEAALAVCHEKMVGSKPPTEAAKDLDVKEKKDK